jgi:serine/threonine-protein kinase HipA
LSITERVLRDEETDADLQLLLAPGSSLGGARPKASVMNAQGQLAIAKFPKETDDYAVERWEYIAMRLARRAGIATPQVELLRVANKPVLLSRRFDRAGATRIPFLSALSMLGLSDGQRGSYPAIVDTLGAHGAQAARDAEELYRRMAFNVLISNVDDHLRNHGFLWSGRTGWTLAPVFDLNPTPAEVRPRILTTNITLDEGTCDIDLVLAAAEYFGLSDTKARTAVKAVAKVTKGWAAEAKKHSAPAAEIRRLESAFDHADLAKALAL